MKTLFYFVPEPETLEELKAMYRKLAMEHHPDKGGDAETMKKINAEYDSLFSRVKNTHKNKDGDKYTTERENTETVDEFKDLINVLMRFDEIIIEIIGCFVWVTGNTKPYKDEFKSLGFLWHCKKKAWYLKPDDYHRKSRRDYDLEEIRRMYGTSGKVNSAGTVKLDEAESA